jgi:imidazolonepropionase-like amidohydrolase
VIRSGMITAALAAFLLSCSHAPTGIPNELPSQPRSLTVLSHVRLWDGSGAPARENVSLVLRGDLVDSILESGASIPSEAKVIDLTGKTIIPALIAAHSHLGLTKDGAAGAQNLTEANVLRQLKSFAHYGVGTVVSLGTDHDFIFDLRAKRQAGKIESPYILTAGHGFGTDRGAPPLEMGMDEVYRPRSPAEALRNVQDLAVQRPDLVKIWVDDFGHSMKNKMNPKIYHEIITEAHKHGLKVAAHVYYLEDAKKLAKSGVNFFGHSVRDRPVDAELIRLMASRNVGLIPTLSLDEAFFVYADHPAWMDSTFFKEALDPGVWEKLQAPAFQPKQSSRKDLEIAKQNALALMRAGIPVGMGTDSGATIYRIQGFAEHEELALLVDAGFSPAEALKAATSVNAKLLGLQQSRGSLVPQMKADFIVLDANPLENIRNTQKIHEVWLEGQKISGAI